MYSSIPEDGWCTPWAETLDLVNVCLLKIADPEDARMLKDYARRLGAGVTEKVEEATHVISEVGVGMDVIRNNVRI